MSFTKKLFKRTQSNGKLQEWTIETGTTDACYRTSEGYVGGAISTTAWTFVNGKGVGKATTTAEEQAIKEAEAKIKKQLKKGWTEDINKVDEAARKVLPQLAKKYEDEIEKLLDSGEELAIQPKLDGIRALGTEEAMVSKEGNIHGPTSFHLLQLVKEILEKYPQVEFTDGEFYNHDYRADFNSISSIVKSPKASEEKIEKAEKYLQYHLYDLNIPNATFVERYNKLVQIVQKQWLREPLSHNSVLKIVPTIFIPSEYTKDEKKDMLDYWHEKWVRDGYEGSMIRTANSNYKMSRVKDLLKRKDWIDDEFEIVNVLEGKGNKAGMAASVVCKDTRGEEFSAGIIGDEQYCIVLFNLRDQYIGKMATIKYQNLTPDRKVPRFGKMKAVRDYE